DISMDLKLTERVVATTVDGKISIEAVPEPDAPEEFWTVKHG
ncbi:MAG TPA: phage tail protein, partial [Pantoea sp.]|nr:phage tail protein [Pantoea sp.]